MRKGSRLFGSDLSRIPYRLLYLAILAFCCIGAYSLTNAVFDVYLAALFGLIGYVFVRLGCEPAPLILGFILGPLMEENLRRALLLSRGDIGVLFTEPLSFVMLTVAGALVLLMLIPAIARNRKRAFSG